MSLPWRPESDPQTPTSFCPSSLPRCQKKPRQTDGLHEIQRLCNITHTFGFNRESLMPSTRKNQEALKPIER